jgi:hypothetical protein
MSDAGVTPLNFQTILVQLERAPAGHITASESGLTFSSD